MLTEIRVNYDIKTIRNGVLCSPIIGALTVICLYFFDHLQNVLSDASTSLPSCLAQFVIFYIIKPFLILFIFMLMLVVIYGIYFLLKHNRLAVILNKEGIWLARYGFMKWDNIDDIFLHHVPTTPMVAIGVRFKDTDSVFKQATLSGKLTIIYSKIFRYPVTLGNFDIDYEIFVSHAKRFMHKT